MVAMLDLNKHRSKCPAVRLAIKRILSVKGRIILLTSSIRTINLINGTGVPLGTRCANMKFGCLNQE